MLRRCWCSLRWIICLDSKRRKMQDEDGKGKKAEVVSIFNEEGG